MNELRRELHAKNKEIEAVDAELKLVKSQQVRAICRASGLVGDMHARYSAVFGMPGFLLLLLCSYNAVLVSATPAT